MTLAVLVAFNQFNVTNALPDMAVAVDNASVPATFNMKTTLGSRVNQPKIAGLLNARRT
jgi:hypothetical protein